MLNQRFRVLVEPSIPVCRVCCELLEQTAQTASWALHRPRDMCRLAVGFGSMSHRIHGASG